MQEKESSRNDSLTAAVSNGQTTSQALTEALPNIAFHFRQNSTTPLDHTTAPAIQDILELASTVLVKV